MLWETCPPISPELIVVFVALNITIFIAFKEINVMYGIWVGTNGIKHHVIRLTIIAFNHFRRSNFFFLKYATPNTPLLGFGAPALSVAEV